MVIKSILVGLVHDVLKVILPVIGGLFIVSILFGQAIAVDSMATPATRAEFFRPLIVTVSIRSGQMGMPGADGLPGFTGSVPTHLLMAMVEAISDFDPTHRCLRASAEARRGLLGVRPAEYVTFQPAVADYYGQPSSLPAARAICEPEINLIIGAARLGRLHLARVSEFIVEDQTYQAALDEYARQERIQRECLELWLASGPEPGVLSPCAEPDAALRIPPPACIERHGYPNPRSPQQPIHRADWRDPETVCRILRQYDEALSFPLIWAAQSTWQQRLSNPIAGRTGAPAGSDPLLAPGGSEAYGVGEAVRYARAQVGKRYIFGAVVNVGDPDPEAFDCSGLVQWSYAQAGIRLPRTAEQQFNATDRVAYDQLRPGDLVFFCCDPDQPWTRVSHVGIYIGNGQMLDAPSPRYPVRSEPVWLKSYIGGGRIRPAANQRLGT